jgi:hypothetical protein
MVTRLKNEPAMLLGLVQAVLAVAVSFGFKLSPEQVGALVALSAAGSAFLVRQQVSPVANPASTVGPTREMITPEPAADLVAAG